MEDEAALVAAFMNSTGCGREDAFNRLASSGGHLGRALNSFFSSDAGPSSVSGRRRSRSPPPPSSLQVSSSSEEEDAVRARPPAPVPARRTRVSRWDSKTRVERRSKSSRRRERRRRCRRDRPRESGTTDTAGGDGDRAADDNRSRRRRFREFREDILSDGEEDEKTNNSSRRRRRRLNPTELTSHSEDEKKADDDNNSRRRRRLNPTELTSDSEDEKKADDNNEDVIDVSSDDGDNDDDDDNYMRALEEAARPARQPPLLPPPHPRNRTFEELFKVPHSLTFKGGFHDAKVHAARRARWLLANVQSSEELPLPSLHQNRDVWGNALVAQCVRDRFVLWHADADADAADDGEGEEEEARKVLGYYDIPHDKLPVVVVVDPVTGQAMDVLHGSAACEFNDFMVRLGPFTDMKPTIPVAMAKKSTTSASPGEQSSIRPATTTTAPTSSSERAAGSRQPAPTTTTTVMRKPPDDAVVVAAVAVAPTCEARQEHAPTTTTTVTTEPVVAPCAGQQPETVEEKVCKVRVRLADGHVVTKEFGSQCAVAALFAYCRSMLGAGGAPPPEKPFRLMRFVGRATEEIGDQNQNASFESLGLHLTTVSVHLG